MADKRIFIGVDISAEARERAAAHIECLRKVADDVRVGWERPEKLHITLKFLGNVADSNVSAISHAMGQIAASDRPVAIELSRTGVFPSLRQPRILWLGIKDPDGALARLARGVDAGCEELGFPQEDRPFRPHLTIGRIREPQRGRQLAAQHMNTQFAPVGFTVEDLVVYESKLAPAGSVYTPISTHRLSRSDHF